jgi:hypothetical protein
MKSLISLIGLAAALPCWAALGGPPSLTGPAVQSSAATTASGAPYTRLESQLPNGTMVHEYVDAGGAVFAVTWTGPFQPDVKSLLGPWFEVYTTQAQQRKGAGHVQQAVQSGDLVVVATGHMGAFAGQAWLSSRLPSGFTPEALK